jgi:hypothetical protein
VEPPKSPKDLPEFLSNPEHEPLSLRAAKAHIQAHYMRRLRDMPFTTSEPCEDGSPSCDDCPHRTGNAMAAYPDLDRRSTDICTQPACFSKRAAAAEARERKRLAEDGIKLLPARQARQMLDDTGKVTPPPGYVDLAQPLPGDRKHRSMEEVIGEHIPDGAEAVKDATGTIHILLPAGEAAAALSAAGRKVPEEITALATAPEEDDEVQAPTEAPARREVSMEKRRKAMAHAVEGVVLNILVDSRSDGRSTKWLAWYCQHAGGSAGADDSVLAKFGCTTDRFGSGKFLAGKTISALTGYLIETATLPWLDPAVAHLYLLTDAEPPRWSPAFLAAANLAGITEKQLDERAAP